MEFLHPILGPSLTGEVDLITTRNAVFLFEGGYVLEDPFKFAVEGRKARAPMAEMLAAHVAGFVWQPEFNNAVLVADVA